MKRHFSRMFVVMIVLSMALLSAGCGNSGTNHAGNGSSGGDKPQTGGATVDSITIGTASAGSSSNAQGIAFAKMINDDLGIATKATAIGGSDAVAKNLADNRVQMGIITAVALHASYSGLPPHNEKADLRVLMALQRAEPRQLVFRSDSGIQTPKDLEGKKIVGKRGAIKDIELFMEGVIKAYELDASKITIIETAETNEATRALKQGTVDAAILPGDLRSGPITELFETTDMSYMSFPDDKLQIIMEHMGPAISKAVIPKDTYKGQTEDVFTPGLVQTLSVRADLPDDLAYNTVKLILGDAERLEKTVVGGKDWIVNDKLPQDISGVPFHPGALKYYKEKGLMD